MRRDPRGINRASLIVLLLAGPALAVTSCQSSPSKEEQADPSCNLSAAQQRKSLQAFQAMMPVFQHPRCLNCHGAVDPTKSREEGGHLAGKTELPPSLHPEACQECHSLVNPWFTPRMRGSAHAEFVGKDAVKLCIQMKQTSGGEERFLEHLRHDDLGFVQEAFKGTRGLNDAGQVIYEDASKLSYRPAPPAISHQRFIALAEAWVATGGMENKGGDDCGCVLPGAYQIEVHRHSKSAKLGTVSDVTYEAIVMPGGEGELEGVGTYRGNVTSWLAACPGKPEPTTRPVSGKLTATASVGDLFSKKMMTFMLTTTDWPLIADGPPAETAEEKEEYKTTGSVGKLALELKGPATSHVDTSKGSLLETPCTGEFRNMVETFVTKME